LISAVSRRFFRAAATREEEAIIPELIKEYPVSGLELSSEGTPETVNTRERRLYFALAAVVSVNLLALCGIVTFVFLVTHF